MEPGKAFCNLTIVRKDTKYYYIIIIIWLLNNNTCIWNRRSEFHFTYLDQVGNVDGSLVIIELSPYSHNFHLNPWAYFPCDKEIEGCLEHDQDSQYHRDISQ